MGLTIYALFTDTLKTEWFLLSTQNWVYLFIFGILCTSVPFLIGMHIKEISPYTVSLTLNLETVYGIILAFFIFHEHEQMTTSFYIATGIILSTIFANGILKNYFKK